MTAQDRSLPRRLLGVWAHPDDECYLSAGLMARIVEAGGHVRIVCATRGEHGTGDLDLAGTDRFARAREEELRTSLSVLGVDDVHFLDLADGGCHHADDDVMAAIVAAHASQIDADAMVTFGPDGMTGHLDHLAVCRWSTMAAPSGGELLYATVTHEFAARHRAMHDEIGLFADLPGARAAAVEAWSLALRVGLDDAELLRKRSALAAHGSQTDGLAEMIGEDVYRTWWRDECFRHPTPAERSARRSDLASLEVVS